MLLGFMIGAIAFQGWGVLAFVLLIGYALVDIARYWRFDQ